MTTKESCQFEIEISAVLLGFLFVMDSIILTIPSDVLDIVKATAITGYLGIPILSFGNSFSLASMYCSLSLLVAILFYFLYLGIKRNFVLLIARTFLAISMYLIVILVVILNGAFMARLVGIQGNAYMNPVSGYVLSLSLGITIAYILLSWILLFKAIQSHRQSLRKGSQGNANRQPVKNKDKATAKLDRNLKSAYQQKTH